MQITKRKLSELWVVGRLVVLDDGQGEPVTVWVQKLSPTDAQEAHRRCDGARAKVMVAHRDHDGPAWQIIRGTVSDYGSLDPTRILDFLVNQERQKFYVSREAQCAGEEEWSKDNYLQGARDAWNGGLSERLEHEPDDPEALKVKEELTRFVDQVNEAVEDDANALRDAWSRRPEDDLIEDMAAKLLESDATQAWITELHACQIYYGTRDPDDHRKRYFESRDEVNELFTQTFDRLVAIYDELEVGVAEGKDSPAPTPSSPSSEEPGEAATEAPYGLVGASQ